MTAETLLSKLDKVKRTGPGRWMARCPDPAHHDKGPSLSVRELEDGRVLVHCFAGCEVASVLAAAGLTFDDLYPERPIESGKAERRPFPAADVLRAISFEVTVVAIAASRILSGKPFVAADKERLFLAASRIQAALTAAGLSHG
jgi:hypothetical protein